MQIPYFAGGVAIIHSLPAGIVPDGQNLQLSADTIALIYKGIIRKWNHTILVEKNPWLADVTLDLVAYGRSDSSGASWELCNYLYNSTDAGPALWTIGVSKFPAFPPSMFFIPH